MAEDHYPNIKPNHTEPTAPIVPPPEELLIPRGEVRDLAAQMGVMALPDKALKLLSDLGIEVERRGVLAVADGISLVTVQPLLSSLLLMAGAIKTPEDAMKYSKAMGSLAGQIQRFDAGLRRSAHAKAAPKAPRYTVRAQFPVGQNVNAQLFLEATPAPEEKVIETKAG